jgi:uncharacterized protein (TIGR03435 family)
MVQTGAAQEASQPTIVLPPPVHSVRANHSGPAMIDVSQPEFPAEITIMNRGDKDWLADTQVKSRTQAEIVSAKLGWAYVLASGLEFHAGDVYTPSGGVAAGGSFQVPAQSVAPRADAKGLLAFVEEVTFADGTVVDADHAKVTAFYKTWSTGANAGKVASTPAVAAAQQNIAGGTAGTGPARTPNLKPIAFDVISFRKSERPGPGREFPADGDFIAYHGSTVDSLLQFAYGGIKKGFFLISGEPDWVKTEYYEFQAKVAPEDVAEWKAMTLTDKRYMVRAALEDALKVKVHEDTAEHPVYNLVVAKGGPKLMDYEPGDTVTPSYSGAQAMTGKVLRWFDPFNLVCQDTTMAELVNSMSGPDRAGRVVIDKTGLTGAYDFTVPIPYRPLPEQFRQIAEDSGVPTMFEGLKQLGLQLVQAKGPIDGIVVDHIERPPDN